MLLNAQNIKKEYGIQTVLDIEKLEIEDGNGLASSAAMAQANPPCWGYWQAGLPAMKALSDETVRSRKSCRQEIRTGRRTDGSSAR